MSRKRPLPGPGQKGSLLYYLKNQPSQKRQTNTLSEQPEQSDQMIETTGQQTEEQHTGQREPETGQIDKQVEEQQTGAIEAHAEEQQTGQIDQPTVQIDQPTVQMEEDTEGQTEETPLIQQQGQKRRALAGAATYRTLFQNEWTSTWPFITRGSLNTHYWCAVCRVENSCCHQGVTDVVRHIKTKGHQEKERALQSTATISQYTMPVPPVGGMSAQEVKV